MSLETEEVSIVNLILSNNNDLSSNSIVHCLNIQTWWTNAEVFEILWFMGRIFLLVRCKTKTQNLTTEVLKKVGFVGRFFFVKNACEDLNDHPGGPSKPRVQNLWSGRCTI
mmetsp:Transcript_5808/g.8844  ORF Transcript_5808/g.8844 Transcript_5808/m.8844 type:complete len:111 (+) Transcript_5808:456-788(+)